MVPAVTPQLVANTGLSALRAAITEPERYAVEPKIDGVRGRVVYQADGSIETRNPTAGGSGRKEYGGARSALSRDRGSTYRAVAAALERSPVDCLHSHGACSSKPPRSLPSSHGRAPPNARRAP